MNRIRWTPLAINDLKSVSSYIEGKRNLATANRVCRIIYDAVQMLRRFPESGKGGIEEGTRELVVPALPSYIVAYRVLPAEPFKSYVSGTAHSDGKINLPLAHPSQRV